MSYFAQSSHFQVDNSSFDTVHGNQINNTIGRIEGNFIQHISDNEKDLAILSRKVAFNAFYNSEARYPQPNVLPGTRKEILRRLGDWIEDSAVKKNRVYWVNGAAGVGKSAIAQALAEQYIAAGQLAAAFFFSRNDPTRDKIDPFVVTIAHQLATSPTLKPLLAPLINYTLRSPGFFQKRLEYQFDALLKEPCAQVDPRHWTDLPRLVIIDGLDECIDVTSQKRLLHMIRTSTATLPLDFLIFSRPEPHITRILRESFIPIPHELSLGDFAVWSDIEQYLRHEFRRLHEEHRATLPESWPGDNVIMVLVQKSTGQFIYVTTIIKFVDTGKVPLTPVRRLEVVLHAEPVRNSTSPYPDLDQLYSQLLHFCLNEDRKLQRALQLIASPVDKNVDNFPFRMPASRHPIGLRSAFIIERFLGFDQSEATVILSGLHSILHIPATRTENIYALHASFIDFLLDPHRSHEYFVGEKLSSGEWQQIFDARRIRWFSQLNAGFEDKSPKHPDDVHDEFGSLNVWFDFADRYQDVTISSELAAALNTFDPHLFLATLLRCHHRLWEGTGIVEVTFLQATTEMQGIQRGWRSRVIAITRQIDALYCAFQMLKQKSSAKLDDFLKKCASFFCGFRVAFPRGQSVQPLLLASQLSISCPSPTFSAMDFLEFPYHFLEHLKYPTPTRNRSGAPPFQILPLETKESGALHARPGWEVKDITQSETNLLRKLLELLVEAWYSASDVDPRVATVLDSKEMEGWTYNLAGLDWKKTWKTYTAMRIAHGPPPQGRANLSTIMAGTTPRVLPEAERQTSGLFPIVNDQMAARNRNNFCLPKNNRDDAQQELPSPPVSYVSPPVISASITSLTIASNSGTYPPLHYKLLDNLSSGPMALEDLAKMPRKKALLIGVEYTTLGENALKGPHEDVAAMRKLLIENYQYDPKDIVTLVDAKDVKHQKLPTHDNMVTEMQNLVRGGAAGDRFLFHYVGHAIRVSSQDREEDEIDEYIVPCDSNLSPHDSELIKDDVLKKILVDRLPTGSHLVSIFDSSHSPSLLNLKHSRCNRVYVPWISKDRRDSDSLWLKSVRRKATLVGTRTTVMKTSVNHMYKTPASDLAELPTESPYPKTSPSASSTSPPQAPELVTQGVLFSENQPNSSWPTPTGMMRRRSAGSVEWGHTPWILDRDEPLYQSPVEEDCTGDCYWYDPSPLPGPPADVMSLSSRTDRLAAWEGSEGSSMTQTLVDILSSDPHLTLKDFMTRLSHIMYGTLLNGDTKGMGKRSFRDPQLSSRKPLDMESRLDL